MQPHIRVLIADDRPRSRDGLRALLATCPRVAVVGEAANGKEAVRLVAECRPDVLVMDARMPVMDGLEATVAVKKSWPRVRVIMLTIYAAYQSAALAAGADGFLVKGCPPDELLDAVLGATKSNSTRKASFNIRREVCTDGSWCH